MVKIILGDVFLEVNQESLSIKKNSAHKVYDLIDGSQSVIPSKANLDVIEFSGFIYNADIYTHILNLIAKNSETYILVVGLNRSINYKVVITDFVTTESGGDIFCINYSIKLLEYKKSNYYSIGSYEEVYSSDINTYDSYTEPTTYVVVKGDCLYNIAKRFLGDGNRYMEIATANNIKNPALIYPGQVIVF